MTDPNRRDILRLGALIAGVPPLGAHGGVSPTVAAGRAKAAAANASASHFSLLSPKTQTAPFCVGFALRMGDIPRGSGIAIDGASAAEVTVKNLWSDGSVKFAVIAGTAAVRAGIPTVIALSAGSRRAGPVLTIADLQAVLVQPVTIACGGFGSASWRGSDWASPFQTWVSGQRMSSWIFRKPILGDAHLVAWLEVRLWDSGAVEILPWVENGYLLITGPTQKSATYTFTMGGTTRFSANIDLLHHQRTPLVSGTALTHWLGTDPDLVVIHDTDYLQDTGLVPCYMTKTPQTAAVVLASMTSYTPLQLGNFVNGNGMSGGGAASHIGLLPEWEAAYLSGPSKLTYKSVLINGYSMGRYPIHYRDESDNSRWARLSRHPTLQVGREPERGYVTTPATSGKAPPAWDFAHHPSVGALCYLLTGSKYFLDESHACASYNSMGVPANPWSRDGSLGIFKSTANGQTRHAAWCLRSLAQAIGITPDADNVGLAELRTQFGNNVTYYKTKYCTVANSANPVRFVEDIDYNQSGPDGHHFNAPWMQDYLTAALGYAMDMDMQLGRKLNADLATFFEWHAPSIIGRMGFTGANEFLYRSYGMYTMATAPTDNPDYKTGAGPWFADWGACYADTFSGEPPGGPFSYGPYDSPGPKTEGPIYGWGVTLTQMTSGIAAIAYCVKHGVPGAMTAYQRLTSAANWHTMVADMDLQPLWGISWHPTPKWARGVGVMAWKQLGLGSRMAPTAPRGVSLGLTNGITTPGFSSRLDAYCGVGTDVRYSRLFTIAAGGHGDYLNNEIVQLDLLAAEPSWLVTYNGSSGNIIPPQTNYDRYPDGQPAATHTYYGSQTLERWNRWLRFGGSLAPGGSGTGTVEGWDAATASGVNGWDAIGVFGNITGSTGIEFALCKDPTTETFYCFNGSKLTRGRPTTGGPNGAANSGLIVDVYQYSIDSYPIGLNSGNEGATAVDFTRNKLLWTHGFSPTSKIARMVTLTDPPSFKVCAAYGGAAGSDFTNEMQGGIGCIYEPRLDAFLMRVNAAGPKIYAIDAASASAGAPTVTTLSTTGGSGIEFQFASGWNGVYNKWTRVPGLRGAVYISGANYQAWFLRLY